MRETESSFLPNPIVLGPSDLLTIDLRLGAQGEMLLGRALIPPGNFARIDELRVITRGEGPAGELVAWHPHRFPALTVEDIARWVAGDGTDAQRVALADGIRAGLPAPVTQLARPGR